MAELTPMLKQYNKIKEKYPNELLFFRLGDFYELFGEDAKKASSILNIVLTARGKGTPNEMPMCGIPHHALNTYLHKLIKAGKRVAICDQVSDASLPGIVNREVTRVITPGTTLEDSSLEDKSNNYIISLVLQKNVWGLAIADLTTGVFNVAEINDFELLKNELFRFNASEVIVGKNLINDERYRDFVTKLNNINVFDLPSFEEPYKVLKNHFKMKNLQSFGVEGMKVGIAAAGNLLGYLKETQKTDLNHILKIKRYIFNDFMALDEATIRNLELFQTSFTGEYNGSLLSVIDKTVTNLGGRMLRRWLLLPLIREDLIKLRLGAVAELKEDHTLIRDLIEKLKQFSDLERLLGRIGCNRTNARDLISLKSSLSLVPEVKTLIENCKSPLLKELLVDLADHSELISYLDNVLLEEPSALLNEGNMIKEGYNKDLDELRKISRGGKEWLLEYQKKEVEKTGISSMKVKFNRVYGYYIEISKANLAQVPDVYIRRQTLVNAERFITPELKEYEEKILGAEDKINRLEFQIFSEVVEKVIQYFEDIQKTADVVAQLDVLTCFARVANENNYVEPEIVNHGKIKIVNGRHPVIEQFIDDQYVPNDVEMDHKKNEFILLTGPNMSGKSSFLRQTALISLLSQLGSFVPAEKAGLCVVDRIFTRVGASDNLTQGISTFMAEMQEAANILNNATKDSLIILDELGRGTSTYDGVSIAWAIIEYIQEHLGAKTIFATHYHELTEIADKLERAENYCVAVSEDNGDVVFLHKIIKGASSDSYGIEVAKLAGLPAELVNKAKTILAGLEKKINLSEPAQTKQGSLPLQLTTKEKDVVKKITDIQVEEMTPLEALQKISELRDNLK
jgi:DNA mismatch repair protein MutS